jgi:hypothetical protein
MSVVPFFAAPLLAALFGWWFFGAKKKRKFPHSDPLSVLYDSGSGVRSQRREARNAKKQDNTKAPGNNADSSQRNDDLPDLGER